ncbi:hypothetical protein DQ04_01681100 [Trypanosoma grayi]|uniref:hypothetical protein n=1 Tax=Trypanosoma grayi TaxID=71804 RepID=UPI0004F47378|nr:hypothetical protein DQ04_01681100 [Trypanosoma grayi]KEG12480.1 hypothetical protein DQ04_01681100 [Trypanosoma grayi]
MSAPADNTAAIYARAEEAQRSGVKLEPVPAFKLYKTAREEELNSYRSLSRAFFMKTGGKLSKQQSRLLEDVRDELCISAERANAEMLAALDDTLVTSVAASGVLNRREDFFDGVADVALEALRDGEMAQDDNRSMFVPPAKRPRTEHMTAAVTSGSWRRGTPHKTPQAALLKTIDKIHHEIVLTGKKLLYSASPVEQQTYQQTLLEKKKQLQELLKEVEGSGVDVSGSSSVNPSELGY